jgi:hypothetical protein
MISHALTIVMNELETHLGDIYGPTTSRRVNLGNLSEGWGDKKPQVPRGVLNLSVVNVKEEKALKNLPNVVRNDVSHTARYQNPPVFLNFQILVAATHEGYDDALLALSRAIRFFQFKNVFTQDNVDPGSLNASINVLDQLESFKLIFDLYSPSMEEINHLWGTLGGKQYPFVLYMLRMIDLQFKSVQVESGLITEVVSDFYHKPPVDKS